MIAPFFRRAFGRTEGRGYNSDAQKKSPNPVICANLTLGLVRTRAVPIVTEVVHDLSPVF